MPKADLVLEGGGVKGLGLVGAVLELMREGYTFPRLAGTSAGLDRRGVPGRRRHGRRS